MQVKQCLKKLQKYSDCTPDLLPQLQAICAAAYGQKLEINRDTLEICKTFVEELKKQICVKKLEGWAGEKEEASSSKPLYEIVRDCVTFVLIRMCNASTDLAHHLFKICLSHFAVCRDCTETLTMLNSFSFFSHNMKNSCCYSQMVELMISSCENGTRIMNDKLLEEITNLPLPTLMDAGANSVRKGSRQGDVSQRISERCDPKERSIECRKELEKSMQSEVTDFAVEESKTVATAGLIRHNYIQSQTVSRSVRRQQIRNPTSEEPSEFPPASNGGGSRPAIPRLNMNNLFGQDASPIAGVQTRSGRRSNATKSVSTRSTRFSGNFSTSFDSMIHHHSVLREPVPARQPQAHFRQQSDHHTAHGTSMIAGNPQNNYSILEGDTTLFHDDLSARQDSRTSAASRLRILAIQLGECCMATDLAALMSKKRELEVKKIEVKIQKVNEKKVEEPGMRQLLFNIFMQIFQEIRLEEIQNLRIPLNAIFLYLCDESEEESMEEISECKCSRLLRNIEAHNAISDEELHEKILFFRESSRKVLDNLQGPQIKHASNVESTEESKQKMLAKLQDLDFTSNLGMEESFPSGHISERSFSQIWNALKTINDIYNVKILSEKAAIKEILHKYALSVEYLHKTISDQISVEKKLMQTPSEEEMAIQLPDPSLSANGFWINSIHFPINECLKPDLAHSFAIRKQTDKFIARLGRCIDKGVASLNISSEETVFFLQQQIKILTFYIRSAGNRIVTQQVIDGMMETLLRLKNKLIELSMHFNIVKVIEMNEIMAREGRTPTSAMNSFLSARMMEAMSGLHSEMSSSKIESSLRSLWQKLFSQFLNLVAELIFSADDIILIKLLNDTFVGSEVWQGLVTTFVLQLFLSSAHGDQEGRMHISLMTANDVYAGLIDGGTVSEKFKEAVNETIQDTLHTLKYLVASCHMLQTVIRLEGISRKRSRETETQIYWKNSIRKTLQSLNHILNPSKGILANFIMTHGSTTHIGADISQFRMMDESMIVDPIEEKKIDSTGKEENLILPVTQAVLNLISHFFSFGPRFSKYFTEEWSLFYIRTHYLSFIRLYNRGIRNEDQIESKIATNLCKLHLKCLLAIAKNRNEETSRNFYKMRCVEFLTREINLEYSITLSEESVSHPKLSRPVEEEPEIQEQKQHIPKLSIPPKFGEKKVPMLKIPIKEPEEIAPREEFKVNTPLYTDNVSSERKEEQKFAKFDSSQVEQHTDEDNPNRMTIIEPAATNSKPTEIILENQTDISKHNKEDSSSLNESSRIISRVNMSASKFNKNVLAVIKRKIVTQKQDGVFPLKIDKQEPPPAKVEIKRSRVTSSSKDVRHKLALNFSKSKPTVPEAPVTEEVSQPIPPVQKNPEEKNERTIHNMKYRISSMPVEIGKGTIVGSNKVFVPLLKFPKDIDNYKDDADGIIKVDKPNDERFKLKRFGREELNKTYTADVGAMQAARKAKKGLLDANQSLVVNDPKRPIHMKDLKRGTLDIGKEEKKAVNFMKNEETKGKSKKKVPMLKLSELKPKNVEQSYKERMDAEEKEVMEKASLPNPTTSLTNIEKSLAQTQKWQLMREDTQKKLNTEEMELPSPALVPPKELLKDTIDSLLLHEREQRNIYKDPELHALMIGLLFYLLLKPPRGVLDELYCISNPSDNGMQNILYLLHFHLNHPLNQNILPLLVEIVSEIKPPLSGQRLLKLLYKSFFDSTIYSNWNRIAVGAFGTIFECSTNFQEPSVVAIKQLTFPNSIYDRCVLFDIFSEIAALQEFRGERCATTLFDYGVDNNNYYIVMKKYHCSLRSWRQKNTGSLSDNLPTYLYIFKQVLKSVEVVHSHNVTHYDLKCDNVMLDIKSTGQAEDEGTLHIALGDFGECKLFTNEEDEYDLKPRGTECIKSPEMLTLTINTRKDTDKYDRRRRVGTTRVSDVWSLGCLFYELITGEYLFNSDDYAPFFIRITHDNEEIICSEKKETLGNNPYLIDFLNFVLVRDAGRRSDITKVVQRFKHIHALLVNATASPVTSLPPSSLSVFRSHGSLDSLLDGCAQMMYPKPGTEIIQERIALPACKINPALMRIMKNVYICNTNFLYSHISDIIRDLGITHVIIPRSLHKAYLNQYFIIHTVVNCECGSKEGSPNAYKIIPGVLDFCRKVALQKGVLLYVDDCYISCEKCKKKGPREGVMRECVLACMSYILQCTGYETWTLINSQVLFMWASQQSLAQMTKWVGGINKISAYIGTYPKYSCLCGSCSFILARIFADEKNITMRPCNCSSTYRSSEISDCPSRGCSEHLSFIKNRYHLCWENIKWGFFERDDFLIGPFGYGMQRNTLFQKIMLHSEGAEKNSICCFVTEKGGTDYSASEGIRKWSLYKCQVCNVWTHARCETDGKIALVLNNKSSKRHSVIAEKTFDKSVTVPILANINMSLTLTNN